MAEAAEAHKKGTAPTNERERVFQSAARHVLAVVNDAKAAGRSPGLGELVKALGEHADEVTSSG